MAARNELAAERELEPAADRGAGDEDCRDNGGVRVQFRHLGERETAFFEVDDDTTLDAIWTEAYRYLQIERGDRDVLQAPKPGDNPVSLSEHLGLTLEQARHRGLCERTFEIAARTGGA